MISFSNVHLFQGDRNYRGISFESLSALSAFIVSSFPEKAVEKVTEDHLKISKLKQHDLLIFPGGNCSTWDLLLNKKIKDKTAEWILNGGRIFAICAGGYYFPQLSIYHADKFNTIERQRDICLFPGKCIGPAYSSDLKIVKVKWIQNKEEGDVVLIGGGFFIPDSDASSEEYEVLAEYMDPPHEGKVAVVMCRKGEGKAVLSGPHWEFNSNSLENSSSLFSLETFHDMTQKLQKSHAFRTHCINEMFNLLKD